MVLATTRNDHLERGTAVRTPIGTLDRHAFERQQATPN
jgi:hypothetical protein